MSDGVFLRFPVQYQRWRDLLHDGRRRGAELGRRRGLREPDVPALPQGVHAIVGLHGHGHHPDLLRRLLPGDVRQELQGEQRLHRSDLLQVAVPAAAADARALRRGADMRGDADGDELPAMRPGVRHLPVPGMQHGGRRGIVRWNAIRVDVRAMRVQLRMRLLVLPGVHDDDTDNRLHGLAPLRELLVVSQQRVRLGALLPGLHGCRDLHWQPTHLHVLRLVELLHSGRVQLERHQLQRNGPGVLDLRVADDVRCKRGLQLVQRGLHGNGDAM
jgi:hypothetical protein